jgi:hypothetical protein
MMPAVNLFKGEIPRLAQRKLPPENALTATNSRLLSGDLECWKNFDLTAILGKVGDIRTIFPLSNGVETAWLAWKADELATGAVEVDVAKSTSSSDGRVFLTGLDKPRWTNYSLATTGSGAFPVTTRPLGLPNPDTAPTTQVAIPLVPPILIVDDFSAPANWTLVPPITGAFAIRTAVITAGKLTLTAQEITAAGLGAVYAYRDCGLGSSAAIEYAFDFKFTNLHTPFSEGNGSAYVMCNAQGAGPRIGFGTAGAGVYAAGLAIGTAWAVPGSTISAVPIASMPVVGSTYRVTITGTRRTNQNYDFRMVVQLGSATPIIDVTFDNVPVSGGFFGHLIGGSLNADRGPIVYDIDNVLAAGTFNPSDDPTDDITTSYVYTYVNDLGEESGPSPASVTVSRDPGAQVNLTVPTSPAPDVDDGVVYKRIYRAATGPTGTFFFFLVELPVATTTYADATPDSGLGEPISTEGYTLPPADLRGILALPNDIYVGFRQGSNELCFSDQGRPHAWPVAFRLKTDEPIIAIGNVDTVVIVATEAFPYTAAGTAPDNYTMTKSEVNQGCVAKRGCAYVKGFGWLYPSQDGLIAIAGVGQPQLITQAFYTRREWQQLQPSTFVAEVHDNRYVAFYVDCNEAPKGLMIDFDQGGFGKITLGFHATAAFSWAQTDTLYLVLDVNEPPTVGSPQTDYQVVPDGHTVYAFDSYCNEAGELTKYLPQQWLSKKWMLNGEVPLMCRIRATDYTSLRLIAYNQGWPYFVKDVVNNKPFRCPKPYAIEQFMQFAIQGTSFVQDVQFGYSADDFT